jgi:hypothetical protein
MLVLANQFFELRSRLATGLAATSSSPSFVDLSDRDFGLRRGAGDGEGLADRWFAQIARRASAGRDDRAGLLARPSSRGREQSIAFFKAPAPALYSGSRSPGIRCVHLFTQVSTDAGIESGSESR